MSLRQKLLLVFSLTVVLAVAAVAWIVSLRTRQAFAEADQKRTAGAGRSVQARIRRARRRMWRRAIERLAASDRLVGLRYDLARPNADASPYLAEAATLAKDYQLDYLEILLPDGSIVSSAQWPARFGYKEDVAATATTSRAFSRKKSCPTARSEIGLFALRAVRGVEPPVYVLGGKRLDHRLPREPCDGRPIRRCCSIPCLTPAFDRAALVECDRRCRSGQIVTLRLIEQAIRQRTGIDDR